MTTSDDSTRNLRSTRRLLGSLRDVLFENTSAVSIEPSAIAILPQTPGGTEIEAARAVLCAAIEAQLGPGIREFSLQNQALSEALPDPAVRRRAALRVLALKGTTREHLCLELEHALATLREQGQAFARKLQGRRDALEASQRSSLELCSHETAEAEQAIQRLQAELDAQRLLIADSQARRDQQLASCEATAAELSAREQAFQGAFHDVEHEHLALQIQLSQESL
jgi:hypothetical protein